MTSITGTTPPVHRRFNEEEALARIRDRYKLIHEKVPRQLEALQRDRPFRGFCADLYLRGYKDWMIISAIYNVILNLKIRERTLDYRDRFAMAEAMKDLSSGAIADVYPSRCFMGTEFEMAMNIFNAACLGTWGFDPRLRSVRFDVIERFLRERMRHFDFDLPHDPLFGDPPGEWPVQRE